MTRRENLARGARGLQKVSLRFTAGLDFIQLLTDLQRQTAKLFLNRMIGQKTLRSFFSPVSKKRISKELNETEDDAKDPVSLSTQVYFRNWLSISHTTVVCWKNVKLLAIQTLISAAGW